MKKMILIFFVFAIFCTFESVFCQLKTYNFEQIDSLQQVQKRNIIVFTYTDWCKFCHAMKAQTLSNTKVIQQLNENFYFIYLNADEKRTIVFNKSNYHFKSSGNNYGVHELAIALATNNNQINYPTLVILNYKNEILFQYSGFLNANNLLMLLK